MLDCWNGHTAAGVDNGATTTLRKADVNAALAPTLNVADRCDRCGAQAYVSARLASGGELLFCAHHGREHLDKLRNMDDIEIIDESDRLHEDASPAVAEH